MTLSSSDHRNLHRWDKAFVTSALGVSSISTPQETAHYVRDNTGTLISRCTGDGRSHYYLLDGGTDFGQNIAWLHSACGDIPPAEKENCYNQHITATAPATAAEPSLH